MNNHDVGYCNPPKDNQFKKGKSGNPSGRPKGSGKIRNGDDYRRALAKWVNEPLLTRINGKEMEITALEAVMKALIVKSIKGDNTSIRILTTLLDKSYSKQEEQIGQLVKFQNALAQIHDDPEEFHEIRKFMSSSDIRELFYSYGYTIEALQEIYEIE